MPPFLLPAPPPLPPPPPPPRAARRHAAPLAARRHAAPLAAASKPTPRRPYRRRPAPAPEPPPGPRNAAPRASFRARSEDELEAAIYDFMRRSDKPGAFPTRAELLAAGRADLAAAVESSGGWISLGWSSGSDAGAAVTAPASSGGGMHPDYPPEPASWSWGGGVHPNYPPKAGASDLAPAAGASGREAEASPSGRQPETEETAEAGFRTGLEGMLTRLQRERERARPPPRSSNQAGGQALMSHSGAPSHIATVGRYTPMVPENENIHSSHSQNGLEDNKALRSSTHDAWRTWSLDKGGFSDFQAAEVHPSDRSKLFEHDDIVLVQDVAHRPSDGVAVNDHPSDGVDSERDEIHSRLHNLELDLTAALKTLRSRFDRVLSDMSNGDGADVLNGLSDSWEFEETKVMQAQEELRSIRAKIAVLEGKMALEIIERNKIIEVKQRRLDEVEKALSELRTVYIVWPNPASEVLLTGSFDGWTSQRRMERSERGIFSLNLRLYPGRYEIKFIVDGVWRNDPLRPTLTNHGHENNLLIVT